jgi:hypothetical protein
VKRIYLVHTQPHTMHGDRQEKSLANSTVLLNLAVILNIELPNHQFELSLTRSSI